MLLVLQAVKISWITKCMTTGYSLPLLSSLLKKEERKKGELISKTGFKLVFRDTFIFHLAG